MTTPNKNISLDQGLVVWTRQEESRDAAQMIQQKINKLGYGYMCLPLLQFDEISVKLPRDSYDCLIATSGRSAWAIRNDADLVARLQNIKSCFFVGAKTAAGFRALGIGSRSLQETTYQNGQQMCDAIIRSTFDPKVVDGKLKGRVLWLRPVAAAFEVKSYLENIAPDLFIDSVEVYKTSSNKNFCEEKTSKIKQNNSLIFALLSPSAARSLYDFIQLNQIDTSNARFVTIGATTLNETRKIFPNISRIFSAKIPTIESMIEKIAENF